MPGLVADVLALADRARVVGRFHLVGHDWGGAVAWHLAARHPERVGTLTAVSTPHPHALAAALRSGAQPLRSAYIAFFRTPRLPELVLGRMAGGAALLLAGSVLGPTIGSRPTPAPWPAGARVLAGAGYWLPEQHVAELAGPVL